MERLLHPSYSTSSQRVWVSDGTRASERRENNCVTQIEYFGIFLATCRREWDREILGHRMLAVNYNVTLVNLPYLHPPNSEVSSIHECLLASFTLFLTCENGLSFMLKLLIWCGLRQPWNKLASKKSDNSVMIPGGRNLGQGKGRIRTLTVEFGGIRFSLYPKGWGGLRLKVRLLEFSRALHKLYFSCRRGQNPGRIGYIVC